ncbi:MAG: substrate-binding periplasmic protein [Candidatus Tectimicrobiota bacterium]
MHTTPRATDLTHPVPPPQRIMRHGQRLLLTLLYLACGTAICNATATEKVLLLTYHTHPPFVTGVKQGLTYDLAAYLTERAGHRYRFEVREMSRPALDKSLPILQAVIVPWVNPIWFHDQAETTYLWSTTVLMHDGMSVISRQEKKVVYTGPASLANLTLGALKGHVHEEIDQYIHDSQALRRVDADQHLDNFHKLLNGRIDVTLTPESAALYLLKREHLLERLFLSPKPGRYARRLFVTQQRTDLRDYIDAAFSSAADQQSWDEILRRYR